MITDDTVVGGLAAELERAVEEQEEGAGSEAAAAEGAAPATAASIAPAGEVRDLISDVRALGVFGVLIAISDAGAPVEDVHREIPARLGERLRAQLEEDRLKREADGEPAPAPVPEGASLPEVVAAFLERKGTKARLVARKTLENAIYDLYDLKDHALFVDDVGRILDVFKSASGASDNAQAFMRRLAALSSDTAKFILGLFPEQLALIYKIQQRQAERAEIDAAFDGFAPRVIWRRVFAILKTLIEKEKRLRLALTVWGRLRGVQISRDDMAKLQGYLAVKDTKDLVARALARRAERARLLDFIRAHQADIAAVEECF